MNKNKPGEFKLEAISIHLKLQPQTQLLKQPILHSILGSPIASILTSLSGEGEFILPPEIAHLPKLKVLNLSHTRVSRDWGPKDWRALLSHLDTLTLKLGSIMQFASIVQYRLPLLNLHLTNYENTIFPYHLLRNLRMLHLKGISSGSTDLISREICYLNRLERLYLDELMIKSIHSSILFLECLCEIRIPSNLVEDLPYPLNRLKTLRTLDVQNNMISLVPPPICYCKNLKYLILKNNKLKFLPANFGLLVNLRILDISKNRIRKLPNSAIQIKHLSIFKANKNNFTEIPQCIGSWKRLQRLEMSHNEIKIIPKLIGELKYLIKLNLSDNKIRKLPSNIGKCYVLKVLNLVNNEIDAIPKNLVWPPHFRKQFNFKNSLYKKSIRGSESSSINSESMVFSPEDKYPVIDSENDSFKPIQIASISSEENYQKNLDTRSNGSNVSNESNDDPLNRSQKRRDGQKSKNSKKSQKRRIHKRNKPQNLSGEHLRAQPKSVNSSN